MLAVAWTPYSAGRLRVNRVSRSLAGGDLLAAGRSGGSGSGRWLVVIFAVEKMIQDAVDKRCGIFAAEPFGKFYGLVNCNAVRCFGEKDFEGTKAEDISVRGGHPWQTPVVGSLFEQAVEFRLVATDSLDEGDCKLFQFCGFKAIRYKLPKVPHRVTRVHLVLEEDLQGDFAGSVSS